MLVTVEEFRESPYNKADFTDADIQKALEYAEARFYRLTKREEWGYWLEPRRCSLRLDGTGTSLLRLPFPLVNLVELRVLYAAGWLELTDTATFRGHFIYLPGDLVFEEGVMNVHVVGDFGDPDYCSRPVPADVKEAIMRLAFMKLRRHYRLAGEQLLERRAPDEAPPPVTYTGDREVDGIIASYAIKAPVLLDVRGPID